MRRYIPFFLVPIVAFGVGAGILHYALPGDNGRSIIGGVFAAATCGNGIIEDSNEECDDLNTTNNDGCSSACKKEEAPTSCGNGFIERNERCDGGARCSTSCQKECTTVDECIPAVKYCFLEWVDDNGIYGGLPPRYRQWGYSSICFEGICMANMSIGQACDPGGENTSALCSNGRDDDGDTNVDCDDTDCAADPNCTGGPSGVCGDDIADAGETCFNCYHDVPCADSEQCNGSICVAGLCVLETVCGDGVVVSPEECDDGGTCLSVSPSTSPYHNMDCANIGSSLQDGVARCRATGGACVAQGGDGCDESCQICLEDGEPCFTDAGCGSCGKVCTEGACS